MTNDVDPHAELLAIGNERAFIGGFLIFLGLVGTYGVIDDWIEGVSTAHLVIETSLNVMTFAAGAWVLLRLYHSKRRSIQTLHSSLVEVRDAARQAEAMLASMREGLTSNIRNQFAAWKLSPAEEDICLFLLKGFSLEEIAGFRNTSERTIRHQASQLYKKTGLSGRAELAAFFMEDLLEARQISAAG